MLTNKKDTLPNLRNPDQLRLSPEVSNFKQGDRTQSLSKRTKCSLGKTRQSASTKVPAQVGCTLHSPLCSLSGKKIFFELCCARHYNCGSHWAVLVLSLLDNEIKRKGQGPRKSRQTKTQNNTKREKDKVTQTFSGPVKVRQPEKTSMYTPLQAQDKQVGESERPR